MKTEKIVTIIGLTLAVFALLLMTYKLYDYIHSGEWSMQHTVKKSLDDTEEFCNAQLISPNKGIAFVNYNCTPINRITKGIKKCEGRYHITVNKETDWTVNKSTKTIIW